MMYLHLPMAEAADGSATAVKAATVALVVVASEGNAVDSVVEYAAAPAAVVVVDGDVAILVEDADSPNPT